MTDYHKLFEAIGCMTALVAIFCLGVMIMGLGT